MVKGYIQDGAEVLSCAEARHAFTAAAETKIRVARILTQLTDCQCTDMQRGECRADGKQSRGVSEHEACQHLRFQPGQEDLLAGPNPGFVVQQLTPMGSWSQAMYQMLNEQGVLNMAYL